MNELRQRSLVGSHSSAYLSQPVSSPRRGVSPLTLTIGPLTDAQMNPTDAGRSLRPTHASSGPSLARSAEPHDELRHAASARSITQLQYEVDSSGFLHLSPADRIGCDLFAPTPKCSTAPHRCRIITREPFETGARMALARTGRYPVSRTRRKAASCLHAGTCAHSSPPLRSSSPCIRPHSTIAMHSDRRAAALSSLQVR